MKTWLIIGAAALVVVAVVASSFVLTPGESVQAAKVRRGDIREFVDERGKTRLPETHSITMPFPGRIERISLEENDRVEQGQIVAQVVPSDLEMEVAEAEAVVERFAASIDENRDASIEDTARRQAEHFVQSMVDTVDAATKQMTTVENRLAFAEDFLADTRELFAKRAKNQEDVDRAALDYENIKVELSQVALMVQAMQSIHAATTLLPQMIDDYKQRKTLTGAVLEKQRAEAQARLDQALIDQLRGKLTSPVAGVVLDRPISNEQFLSAGTVLMEIGRLERLEIEADVLSTDVVNIQLGDEVEIYGPAVGADVGNGVRGTVHRIYPAGFTKISSLGVEQQRVKVIIRFAEGVLDTLRSQREIGVGYRVRVRVFTEQKLNALIVPRSALFRSPDGGWQLFAVRGGRARLLPVEVGLMNDLHAEITKGVEQNDTVVLAPESSLVDGDKVKPIVR